MTEKKNEQAPRASIFNCLRHENSNVRRPCKMPSYKIKKEGKIHYSGFSVAAKKKGSISHT